MRFRSDETMVFKGFAVSYVAIEEVHVEEKSSESDSEETATAFPGSLKSIYSPDFDQEGEVEEGIETADFN